MKLAPLQHCKQTIIIIFSIFNSRCTASLFKISEKFKMASEVVVLSSSDEGENDEVQFCGVSQSEKAGNFRDVSPQRSDE